MRTFIRSAAAAIILTSLSAGVASAATMTADYEKGNGREINITSSSQGSFRNVYAGSFKLSPVGGDDIISFCVDLAHFIADGVTYEMKSVSESGFSGVVQTNIKRLFSSFYGTLGTDNDENSAFQVALWEIIDENAANPLNLNSGTFRTGSSTVKTRAQQMLDGLGVTTDAWELTFNDATGYQDQISARAVPIGAEVPLPAGLPLLLTAVGGFAAMRRLRKTA